LHIFNANDYAALSIKITIAHIAKALNTTPATVSRALNDHPGISAKTKKTIHEAAKKLNYKRNTIASSLRLGKSYIVGVIIPSAEINFFGSVVHGIENVANQRGYNILIYQSNESRDYEVKAIETFLSARVDGILVSIAKDTLDYSHFINVNKLGIPIIFFDRANTDIGIHSVIIDDYKGAFIATQHLVDQGYKRIAHISGPQHIKIFRDRQKGYMAALKSNNIKFQRSFVYNGDVSIEAGRQGIAHLLSLPEKPDAVFAVEDFTALGAIKQLKEQKIKIPKDFGVIGFANESFGEHITPTLSTVDQQTVLMGRTAFELLMQVIDKKETARLNKQPHIILEPIPVFRNSSTRKKVKRKVERGMSKVNQ
jgi:LacI family transcriptional regulator